MAGNSLFTTHLRKKWLEGYRVYENLDTIHEARGNFLVAWLTITYMMESPSRRNIIVCLLWNREAPPALFTSEEFVARCIAEMPLSRK